jgi:hypothetical protein
MWYLISLTVIHIQKKEDHIVGTYQRRKTTLLEQIKEGRPHCWNRSKKEDHIVGTDQRRKTTLLNYIAVYIGVGAFIVTALVAVIVFATLR